MQFEALRDGDRFFYKQKGVFTKPQLHQIKHMTMASILCNNLKGIISIQPRAFFVWDTKTNRRISCERIPKLDLTHWKERKPSGDFMNEDEDYKLDDDDDVNDIIDDTE